MASPFYDLLKKWTAEQVVSQEIAEKMKRDWQTVEAEQAGNRWTIALSTLGALLLGIAAISFISINWDTLHRFTKIGLFVVATFISFGGGVYLKEIQKDYQKTGHALLFLSALLFGGTLSLIAQIYQLGGDAWKLLAIWTVGILPIAYVFLSGIILRLALFTGILSLLLFISGADTLGIEDLFETLLKSFLEFQTLLLFATALFAAGSLHFFAPSLEEMGKILRLLGVKIFLFFLFWLTFLDISKEIFDHTAIGNPDAFLWKNLFIALLSGGMAIFFFSQKTRPLPEIIGFFLSLFTAILSLFVTSEAGIFTFTVWANIVFIIAIGTLLKEGYSQQNLSAVNFATFGIGVFLFGKYIDLFFEDMDTTLFFLIGGILLIGGGIFLERKRRDLTASFSHPL